MRPARNDVRRGSRLWQEGRSRKTCSLLVYKRTFTYDMCWPLVTRRSRAQSILSVLAYVLACVQPSYKSPLGVLSLRACTRA
eukprot:6177716-Pleurochrysis_carterae.AAC.3